VSVAVVLRGHLRTWNFCKTSLFQVLESEYTNIDWYMVTWRESVNHQRIQSLHQDFQGRNFTLKVVEEPSSLYNAWTSIGKCCMEVADIILEKQYTTVVETRPDVYLHLHPEVHLPEVQPDDFYTSGYVINWGQVIDLGAHDWFLMYDAASFHLFAHERFNTIEAPVTGHLKMARTYNKALMSLPYHQGFDAELIRPSIWEVPDVYGHHGAVWMQQWDEQKKKEVLVQQDIALADYYTTGVASLNRSACYE